MKEPLERDALGSTIERNEVAIKSANDEIGRLRQERVKSARIAARARRGLKRLTHDDDNDGGDGNGNGATP